MKRREDKYHKSVNKLWGFGGVFVITMALASPCLGASVTIIAEDQGDGGVAVTANGAFQTCTSCNDQGACTSTNQGNVSVKNNAAQTVCNGYGSGSATCTAIFPRYHGTSYYEAYALDCKGYADDAHAFTEFTFNNTPSISVTGPSGKVSEPFDITGTATFKPALTAIKGHISFLMDWRESGCNKSCSSENCTFSYKELTGNLYDLPHGDHTLTVYADGSWGGDARLTTVFSVDKTPTVSVTGPNGSISGPFDITGTATFKPTLSTTKGTISAYINWINIGTKTCTTKTCSFSYKELTGKLYTMPYNLPPGSSYNVQLTANGSMGGTASDQKTFFVEDIIPDQGCPAPTPGTCDSPCRKE